VRGVAALEAAVREAPEWVVLRYGMFYGPDTWFAPAGLRAADAKAGTLVADGDVTSFLHVDDAAAAATAALEWPSGAVNVCDDEPAAARDWVPAFCASVGAPAPPVSDAPRRAWARGADNRRARDQLGWRPRHPSWRHGFELSAASSGRPRPLPSPTCRCRSSPRTSPAVTGRGLVGSGPRSRPGSSGIR
jgi:nucleoside-diphosphate-sugar epimerase